MFQVKNLIYHAVKQCVTTLNNAPVTSDDCQCNHNVTMVTSDTQTNSDDVAKADHLKDLENVKDLVEKYKNENAELKKQVEALKLKYEQDGDKNLKKSFSSSTAISVTRGKAKSLPSTAQYQPNELNKLSPVDAVPTTAAQSYQKPNLQRQDLVGNLMKRDPKVSLETIPKSAFQGVQNAVDDLRKKHPPPQTLRKAPETPEPMDTNQDSCSPKPGTSVASLFRQDSSLAQKSRPYDHSNSETDSNEEIINSNSELGYTQFHSAYPHIPTKGPLIREQSYASPTVSPGFHPKALNLQISSPKQPGIFNPSDASTTYTKQPFIQQTDYNNVLDKDVKQSYASHLATYLPEHVISNIYNEGNSSWGCVQPRKSTQSPVTPTMSPIVSSRTTIPSPATPSPPPTCKSLIKPAPVLSDNSPLGYCQPNIVSVVTSSLGAKHILSRPKLITPKIQIRKSPMSKAKFNRLRSEYGQDRYLTTPALNKNSSALSQCRLENNKPRTSEAMSSSIEIPINRQNTNTKLTVALPDKAKCHANTHGGIFFGTNLLSHMAGENERMYRNPSLSSQLIKEESLETSNEKTCDMGDVKLKPVNEISLKNIYTEEISDTEGSGRKSAEYVKPLDDTPATVVPREEKVSPRSHKSHKKSGKSKKRKRSKDDKNDKYSDDGCGKKSGTKFKSKKKKRTSRSYSEDEKPPKEKAKVGADFEHAERNSCSTEAKKRKRSHHPKDCQASSSRSTEFHQKCEGSSSRNTESKASSYHLIQNTEDENKSYYYISENKLSLGSRSEIKSSHSSRNDTKSSHTSSRQSFSGSKSSHRSRNGSTPSPYSKDEKSSRYIRDEGMSPHYSREPSSSKHKEFRRSSSRDYGSSSKSHHQSENKSSWKEEGECYRFKERDQSLSDGDREFSETWGKDYYDYKRSDSRRYVKNYSCKKRF